MGFRRDFTIGELAGSHARPLDELLMWHRCSQPILDPSSWTRPPSDTPASSWPTFGMGGNRVGGGSGGGARLGGGGGGFNSGSNARGPGGQGNGTGRRLGGIGTMRGLAGSGGSE